MRASADAASASLPRDRADGRGDRGCHAGIKADDRQRRGVRPTFLLHSSALWCLCCFYLFMRVSSASLMSISFFNRQVPIHASHTHSLHCTSLSRLMQVLPPCAIALQDRRSQRGADSDPRVCQTRWRSQARVHFLQEAQEVCQNHGQG